MTLTRRVVRVDEALRELSKQTKVAVAADGNEAPSWQIAVAVKDEPLRDVLRALAAVNNCHWKQRKTADGRDVLTLMDASDDPHYWDFLRPKTQAEADMRQSFEGFPQQVSNLPPDVQKSLAVEHVGVPFTSLPPEMQENIVKAVQGEREIRIAAHMHPQFTVDDIGTTHVSLKSNDHEGITNYTLNLSGDAHSMMIVVGIPDDPSARDNTIRPQGFSPWHDNQQQALATWFDASRAKAINDDPRLSQSVSVKADDVSVGFPLVALAEAAHVNIVSGVSSVTHTVSLGPIPLKDALDQIAIKYHEAWAEAADGTILVGSYVRDSGEQGQKTATK